jgi:hypothetical protein
MKLSDWHPANASQHPKHLQRGYTVGVADVVGIEDSDTCDRVIVTMKDGTRLAVRGPGVGQMAEAPRMTQQQIQTAVDKASGPPVPLLQAPSSKKGPRK